MNLHGIVRSAISAVNPEVSATVYRASSYAVGDDFVAEPSFDDAVTLNVQKQAVTQSDIAFLEAAGIATQGTTVTIYTNGNWCGMNRDGKQGGDKFVIGVDTWRVIAVPEIWPDWTRVIACLQTV